MSLSLRAERAHEISRSVFPQHPSILISLARAFSTAAILLCLLSACGNLAGPDYTRPQAPQKELWSGDEFVRVNAAETIRPDWWRNFNDPYLDDLIERAIADNIDLRILAARSGVAEAAISQQGNFGLEENFIDRIAAAKARLREAYTR